LVIRSIYLQRNYADTKSR